MRDVLFLVALSAIWAGVAYIVVLAIGGVAFHQRWRERVARQRWDAPRDWPSVSVIIPAHNEERVIKNSLQRFLALDYPSHRLQIVVVDDASEDSTGRVCDEIAAADPRITVVHVPFDEGGRGKSAALNIGLQRCTGRYIAVYDADHRPHPDAVLRMVAGLEDARDRSDVYVGAVGRIVKFNRSHSVLNRFCSFEFSAFQWIFQGGRSQLFDIATFPGTNFICDAAVLRRLGGWDPLALTEDLELSHRVYRSGRRIVFTPDAISEEQDVEAMGAWFRQRGRWVVGNYYVLRKHWRSAFELRRPRVLLDFVSMGFNYIFLFGAVVMSDVLFAYGLITGDTPSFRGSHFVVLWMLAALVFVSALLVTQALEGEDGWTTPLLAAAMYLTYAQLWLWVAARGFVIFARTGGKLRWVRTPRFQD